MKIKSKLESGVLRFKINHSGVPSTWTADIFVLMDLAITGMRRAKLRKFGPFMQPDHYAKYEQFYAINTCSCGVAGCAGFMEYQCSLSEDSVLHLVEYGNEKSEDRVDISLKDLCDALKLLEDELYEMILLDDCFTCIYGYDDWTADDIPTKMAFAQDRFIDIMDDIQTIKELTNEQIL